MYPGRLITTLAIVSLFVCSLADAADKVVVIPLRRPAIMHNGMSYGTVRHNGKIWLDRNLGAARVARSYNDPHAFGDLYQWGRGDDGHENRTSSTTAELSPADTPGHDMFITTNESPVDWRHPQNNSLWQGINGINNPCPAGFRLPTETEWETELTSWASLNRAGAFASSLKLVGAGLRYGTSGNVGVEGINGLYWSATVDGMTINYLLFSSGQADIQTIYRVYGLSVRCIKD